ncbi:group II intron maturase-specific domain-containing protein [Algoriphagus sp. NBT04N3]|uniref:group II intron maturase-specific domain-containing protein n=1 Tax=Algoriphagus sp. NBT04N3 TaxID=2705473 RepID=UPI00210613FE|nr:group II intron maturase-specific domain-containing protein [Algoriphagus sp. NBT04N3]
MKKQSWVNLKRKLKWITKKTLPYSFEERLQKLNEVWMGWVNNYRLASIQGQAQTTRRVAEEPTQILYLARLEETRAKT